LERRLLLKKCEQGHERVREDAVVKELVDFSVVQYAVIKGLHTGTGHERLVIAYRNEQSLRDLIAASSIVAFGLSSREEAVAGSRACLPTAVAYPRILEAMAVGETEKHQQGLSWVELRGETGSVLRRLARFLATSWSDVVTSAIVVFSSSNLVSAAIRIALGSSV
jgi:hypothetical protein